jgi:hypothetical protein
MVNSKLLMNQWRNEPSSRDQLGHHLAFTKSAQEPECGHENAMFSGRTIYVLRQLHLRVRIMAGGKLCPLSEVASLVYRVIQLISKASANAFT